MPGPDLAQYRASSRTQLCLSFSHRSAFNSFRSFLSVLYALLFFLSLSLISFHSLSLSFFLSTCLSFYLSLFIYFSSLAIFHIWLVTQRAPTAVLRQSRVSDIHSFPSLSSFFNWYSGWWSPIGSTRHSGH
jgi:hypothetical protein